MLSPTGTDEAASSKIAIYVLVIPELVIVISGTDFQMRA
jgi:hypothetical protein